MTTTEQTETSTSTPEVSESRNDGPTVIQAGDTRSTVIATPTGSTPGSDSPRGEVSAATIARMLGLATVTEVKFLEGKIDLVSTKLNTITAKLEKAVSILNGTPTGSDLERIDVQIGALRAILTEVLTKLQEAAPTQK